MSTISAELIDLVWLLGPICLLATVSYLAWYGRVYGEGFGATLRLPRALVPICLSLEFFCIGLAMKGVGAFRPAPWWEVLAWSILAILFAAQTVVYGLAGLRHGWDTPIESRKHDGL